MSRVNVNGGAIAWATRSAARRQAHDDLAARAGADRQALRLQTMCIGFGQGIATIIERL